MALKLLDESVKSHLRSGVAISCISQCVEELVLNSIDAGAQCITVRIDIPKLYVQVVDNGTGISREDLQLLGERYATSKCHDLEDLHNLGFHGYRGEAMASITSCCGVVECTTRHCLSTTAYSKVFHHGRSLGVCPARTVSNSIHKIGTTVTVQDIFYNMPVRRRVISNSAESDRVCRTLTAVSLIHPSIAIVLYDNAISEKVLHTKQTNSLLRNFEQLFGRRLSVNLREISASKDSMRVHGYMSTTGHYAKSHQFIYINKRYVKHTRLHSHVNHLLSNSLITRKVAHRTSARPSSSQEYEKRSTAETHGVFVLNLECPLDEYDICLEPAKTLVEFKNWVDVLALVEEAITSFLVKNNLSLGLSVTDSSNAEMSSLINQPHPQTQPHPLQSTAAHVFEYGMKSRTAHRHQQQQLTPTRPLTSIMDENMVPNNHGDSDPEERIYQLPYSNCSDPTPLVHSTSSNIQTNAEPTAISNHCPNVHNPQVVPIGCKRKLNPIGTTTKGNHSELSRNLNGIKKICLCRPMRSPLHGSKKCSIARKLSGGMNQCNHGNQRQRASGVLLPSMTLIDEQYGGRHIRNDTGVNDGKMEGICSRWPPPAQSSISNKKTVTTTYSFITPLSRDNYVTSNKFETPHQETNSSHNISTITPHPENTGEGEHMDTLLSNTSITDIINYRNVIDLSPPSTTESPCFKATNLLNPPDNDLNTSSIGTTRSSSVNTTAMSSHLVPITHPVPITSPIGTNCSSSVNTLATSSAPSPLQSISITHSTHSLPTITHSVPITSPIGTNCSSSDVTTRSVAMSFVPSPIQTVSITYPTQSVSTTSLTPSSMLNISNSTTDSSVTNHNNHHSHSDCNSLTYTEHSPLRAAPHLSYGYTNMKPRTNRPHLQTISTHTINGHTSSLTTDTRPHPQTDPIHRISEHTSTLSTETVDTPGLKWREWPSLHNADTTSLDLLSDWTNPAFACGDTDILNVGLSVENSSGIRIHSIIHPYKFTNDIFTSIEVLGQIDQKFVACLLKLKTEDCKCHQLLVFFDQHAVHERIRVEALINDAYRDGSVISVDVQPPQPISLTETERKLLCIYRKQLETIGVQVEVDGCGTVLVHSMPSVFCQRDMSERRKGRSTVAMELVQELVSKQLDLLSSTHGVCSVVPTTILQVLNSQACHGAIKFGDPLSVDECTDLIRSLSKCNLPFQCAHGRPSLIPILDLDLLQKRYPEQPSPTMKGRPSVNIAKLKNLYHN